MNEPIAVVCFEEVTYDWRSAAEGAQLSRDRSQWIDRNNLDVHYDFSERDIWEGSPSKVVCLALSEGVDVPWFLRYPNFLLGSLLLAGAPLRASLKAHSIHANVRIRKAIGYFDRIRPLDPKNTVDPVEIPEEGEGYVEIPEKGAA
jgi:hypothetical protein